MFLWMVSNKIEKEVKEKNFRYAFCSLMEMTHLDYFIFPAEFFLTI